MDPQSNRYRTRGDSRTPLNQFVDNGIHIACVLLDNRFFKQDWRFTNVFF